jgi:co-chaperonin GroES (HSP10)
MKIQPTGNRILIKVMDEKEISPGGIFIPHGRGAFNLPATVGTVIEVGPGYLEDVATNKWTPCNFKKGQIVLFNKDAGLKIPKETLQYFLSIKEAEDYVLVMENQIMAVIKNEKEDNRKSS